MTDYTKRKEEAGKVLTTGKRLSSAKGKEILSIVRGGDYAHAGETAAVDLVF